MTPRGGTRIGAGRKPASTTGKPNGRRVNVYLTPANFETWRGLPDGKRSEYVNETMAEITKGEGKGMTTSPIPTVVSTVTNGVWTHEIIIPANATEIEAAASKTLTFIGSDGHSTRYSNLGIAALWNAFTDLTGIF